MKGKVLLFCAIFLSGGLSSVATSANQVTLVDDGATKVEKAASLEEMLSVRPFNYQLLAADVVLVAPAEPVSFAAVVSAELTTLAIINPQSTAERVTENLRAGNYKTGYRPPAFRPEKTGKIYLQNCDIRQC